MGVKELAEQNIIKCLSVGTCFMVLKGSQEKPLSTLRPHFHTFKFGHHIFWMLMRVDISTLQTNTSAQLILG